MATYTIHPTNVRDDGLGTTAATIVGAPDTVWADGSDATYTETSLHIPEPAGTWNVLGDVQADIPSGRVAISDISLRVQRINGGGAVDKAVRAGVVQPTDPGPELGSSALIQGSPSVGPYFGVVHTGSLGTIETISGLTLVDPSTGEEWTDPSALAALFQNGFTVAFRAAPLTFPYADGTYTLRVYEVSFTLTDLSPCFKTLAPTWAAGDGTGFVTNGEPSDVDTYNGRTPFDLSLGVRASSDSGGTFAYHLWVDYGGSPASELIGSVDFALSAGAPEGDHVHTLGDADFASWGTTLAEVVGKFSTGAAAVFLETADDVVYYDVWVQVGHKCVVFAPPLRRFPRSDGLGIGPRRHFPPPESRRAAGGYH